mgnify:CR=1 FL=1
MIFVTVGTQLPFDRLINAVDKWAALNGRTDVHAQIATGLAPSHICFDRSLSPQEFDRRVAECDLLIAHAGTGSIFTALEYQRPLIVMPRRADLGEHRNEHQMATAKHFTALAGVQVAMDERELAFALDHLDSAKSGSVISPWASDELLDTIKRFIGGA